MLKEFKGAYGKDVKIDFEKITATIATLKTSLVTHLTDDKAEYEKL